MELKFTATVFKDAEKVFTGSINEIKGVIAQGETLDEVKNELFKILRIKFEIERKKHLMQKSDKVTTEEYNFAPV